MQQLNASLKFSWLLFSCLCILLIFTTGCADLINDNTKNNSSSVPICTDNSQCPKRQVCNRSYCTLEETAATKIGLTFIPPHSTSYQPQRIEPFQIDPKISLQIGLKASVLVRGDISYDSSSLPGPSGLLSVRISEDRTGFHTQQTRVDAGRFEIYLLPGRYTVSFMPDESSIPAFSWQPEAFTSDTELKLSLPNPKSILTVQGNITFQPVTEPSGTGIPKDVPIEEARIMAISEKGLSSTTAITSDIGHFLLNVWPNSGVHDLHISPVHMNSLMPAVIIRNAFTAHNETILAPQTLGIYPNAILSAQIRLHLADAQSKLNDDDSTNIDWAQTTVILHADMGHGLLKLTPQISKDGFLDFKALEGKYTIEIIPPLDSRYARTSLTHDLSSANSIIEIELPLKKNVRGVVYDSEGNTVDNVKIKFSPKISGDSQLRSNAEARTITVTTDDDGQFNTWLEHTGYQTSIIPLATSGLPRTFTTIDTAKSDFDADDVTISIPHPVIIHGALYDEDGRQPMANVSVQGYNVINGQYRVIAEALTNARGEFILVTPAPQPHLSTAAKAEMSVSD